MNRFRVLLPVLAAVVLLAGSVAPAFAAGPPPWAGPPPEENIVETAIALNSSGDFAGQFDILIAAIGAADPVVAETLTGKGQFAVFAPTDEAFENAAADLGLKVDQLVVFLVANPDVLTDILLYHVARGRLNSDAVIGSDEIRTLQGGFLTQDGGVLTDNLGRTASIIVTDVTASNGIIHAIDNVVLPSLP